MYFFHKFLENSCFCFTFIANKIYELWDDFMPLLDSKYPSETRQVAVACLLGLFGGDTSSMPPHIFYQKCLKKLEVLRGYGKSGWDTTKFLNTIYELCGTFDPENPTLMMASIELLLNLTTIPSEPRESDINKVYTYLQKYSDSQSPESSQSLKLLTKESIKAMLYAYQSPEECVQRILTRYPSNSNSTLQFSIPQFGDIKRILVKNRALDFAFKIMESESPQMKSLSMMLLLNLVGRYPDFDELIEYCGENMEERNQNKFRIADALLNMAQDHFVRGQADSALIAFEEANRFIPNNPMILYFKCGCLVELGRIHQAKEEARQLIEITKGMTPNGPMPESLWQLARINLKHWNKREDLEEAVECLEQILDNHLLSFLSIESLSHSDVVYRLSNTLEKLGHFGEAFDRLHSFYDSLPSDQAFLDHTLNFECGRMALICKDYESAELFLERALQCEPMDVHSKYHYALALFHNHKFSECHQITDDILEMRSNDDRAIKLKIELYTQSGDLVNALHLIDSSLNANPDQPYLHYTLSKGVIFEAQNKTQETIQSFLTAVQIWQTHVNQIGSFSSYFSRRLNHKKALTKIQMRCDINAHSGNPQWDKLCDSTFKLGMSS